MTLTEKHREEVGFLRLEQVLELVPVGRSTLYRMMSQGQFPTPCKFGHSRMWAYDEVRRWAGGMRKRKDASAAPRRNDDDII
ncbi:helix-turn-helix transcriptional regulator [Amorphus orientalis]|uniref:DNA-binding transcriptional regulator AlpA n=1 Tax=Amorphus orientalis TaxID=649198 RepID=A0AAE4ATW8_9HYPH|nr:putative DNA-binding transcriptional regulator AlpA [Amorphus orientalis]